MFDNSTDRFDETCYGKNAVLLQSSFKWSKGLHGTRAIDFLSGRNCKGGWRQQHGSDDSCAVTANQSYMLWRIACSGL